MSCGMVLHVCLQISMASLGCQCGMYSVYAVDEPSFIPHDVVVHVVVVLDDGGFVIFSAAVSVVFLESCSDVSSCFSSVDFHTFTGNLVYTWLGPRVLLVLGLREVTDPMYVRVTVDSHLHVGN